MTGIIGGRDSHPLFDEPAGDHRCAARAVLQWRCRTVALERPERFSVNPVQGLCRLRHGPQRAFVDEPHCAAAGCAG